MRNLLKCAALAIALSPQMAFADDGAAHKDKHAHAGGMGEPGMPGQVSREIQVLMADTMRFSPSHIAVKRGETIRFVVSNHGKLKHEMVLGSMKELKQHAALMRKFPEMEHAEPNQISIEGGRTGELVWKFSRSGKVDFACLQPGHFEAGMVGKVDVK